MGREVNNAIGSGTHDHNTERQYFYVLLELEIPVERDKYIVYAVSAAQLLAVPDTRPTVTMHI